MGVYPQSTLSIGQVLDHGFRLYREGFKPLLPLAIAFAVLAQLPGLAQLGAMPDPQTGEAGSVNWAVLAPAILVWLVPYYALFCGIIRSQDGIARGEAPLSFGSAFGQGLRRAWPAFLATLLYALALMLGLVLLVIPGIILSMTLFLSFYIASVEDSGAMASIKESHRLVWGHWWRSAAVVTVAVLVYTVPSLLVGGIGGFFVALGSAGGENPDPQAMVLRFMLVSTLVQLVVTALLFPLLTAITLVLWRELQLRKSGADLAARAALA